MASNKPCPRRLEMSCCDIANVVVHGALYPKRRGKIDKQFDGWRPLSGSSGTGVEVRKWYLRP